MIDDSAYIFYETIIGSHAYGMATPDSDYDIRGIYLACTDALFRLRKCPDEIEFAGDKKYFEIKKFLSLALQGNPNILEVLFAPNPTFTTTLSDDLMSIRSFFISKRLYPAYRGYAWAQYKEIANSMWNIKEDDRLAKKAFHMLRLLTSAEQAFLTGIPLVDLQELDTHTYDFLKSVRMGKASPGEILSAREDLEDRLKRAYTVSDLPEEPDTKKVEQYLLSMRYAIVRGEAEMENEMEQLRIVNLSGTHKENN